MNESTAVTTRDTEEVSPELAQAREELAKIQQAGLAAVERHKTLNAVARMLEGCKWGDISGQSLSPQTRYGIARICDAYRADPLLHIHILGGRVYLNADYWTGKLNALPELDHWLQNNITKRYSTELREIAKQTFQDAKEFEDEDMKDQARRILGEARYADEARAYHGIPDDAEAAYETLVYLDGKAEPIREANHAPNHPTRDPVGKARPEVTAKTRSLRRAAVKACPDLQTSEVKELQRLVSDEFEIVLEDKAADRAIASAPTQAVAGNGEPEAAHPAEAQPLPVEGEDDENGDEPDYETVEAEPEWDRTDAHKRLFATLKDAGITGDKERKAWAADLELPRSTKKWTRKHYETALTALYAPVRDDVLARIESSDEVTLEELSRAVLGMIEPDYLKHWMALQAALDARGITAEEVQGGEDL